MNRTERLTRDVLLFGIVPAWITAGGLDWWCHRRTRIEETSGLPESLSHVAQLAQASVPATLALFLEADPPLLALTYAAAAVHTATAYLDVAYTAPRRQITPTEQHAHAFLEVLPIAGAAFLSVLHPTQTGELFFGKRRKWRLRANRHPSRPWAPRGPERVLGYLVWPGRRDVSSSGLGPTDEPGAAATSSGVGGAGVREPELSLRRRKAARAHRSASSREKPRPRASIPRSPPAYAGLSGYACS